MEFTPAARQEFERLVARYPTRHAALLPTLRLIERESGAISDDGIRFAAGLLGLSPARVLGVVSFYTHYRRPGDGTYVIQVCATLPCALRGCSSLVDAVSKKLGVRPGQTTPDRRFTLKKAECLAACDLAPVMTINDAYHGPLTPEDVGRLLDRLP